MIKLNLDRNKTALLTGHFSEKRLREFTKDPLSLNNVLQKFYSVLLAIRLKGYENIIYVNAGWFEYMVGSFLTCFTKDYPNFHFITVLPCDKNIKTRTIPLPENYCDAVIKINPEQQPFTYEEFAEEILEYCSILVCYNYSFHKQTEYFERTALEYGIKVINISK